MTGMGGHELPNRGETDVWLTPRHVLDALGPFDLDPCAQPGWTTAAEHITEAEDGLARPWHRFVWMNPPYSHVRLWLERLAEHGDGIALIFARTETRTFHELVWRRASAVLFPLGRLTFLQADGTKVRNEGSGNAGAPSVFVAYGDRAAAHLGMHRTAVAIPGALIDLPEQMTYVQSTIFAV